MNARGGYGTQGASHYYRPVFVAPSRSYVGQGSLFGHTPGDVENELDQLHGEIMCFGQELIELKKVHGGQAAVSVQKERDEELAAWKVVDSFQPLVNEVERIEKLLNAAGIDKKTTLRWRLESVSPYADIVMSPVGGSKASEPKRQFVAALTALDKFMPKAQRMAAISRSRELSQKRADSEYKAQGEFPLVQWDRSTWAPFFTSWSKFRGEKKDIPLQTWPLSGTWDRIQDYRAQFIELYNKAPFKPKCPKPLDPRKDPSITGGIEEFLKIAKWGLIGALGIGAVVAISSAVSNVKRGRDPIEPYAGLLPQGATVNDRGQYGTPNGYRSNGYRGVPRVGLIHTPQDTEDEMDQLHNEIMQFGTEVSAHVKAAENELTAQPGYQAILKRVRDADAYYKSIKSKPREELAERMARALKTPAFDGQSLTEPWVKDTVRLPHVVAADPELAKDLDVFLQKVESVRRLNAVQSELRDEYSRLSQASPSPTVSWESRVWEPFRMEWLSWRSDHQRPAQLWPGSGAWDRIQDYRAKYIEIRNKAPFKAVGPSPIKPEDRRDPSLLGGLADFASTFKWVALGVLGIGGVLAVSSIASNLKKKR